MAEEYYQDFSVRLIRVGRTPGHVGFVSFWTQDGLEYKNNIALIEQGDGTVKLDFPSPQGEAGGRLRRTIDLIGPRLEEAERKTNEKYMEIRRQERLV